MAAPAAAGLLRVEGFTPAHGFSTREGGVSTGPWASLNMGTTTGDDEGAVERNRRIFASWFPGSRVCRVEQVHGHRVVEARPGELPPADAQVSADPELLLVTSGADCPTLLVFDPESGAVGAAHCGWRGTVAGIAGETVAALSRLYGSDPARLQVAIGPGICAGCYQVGDEVVREARAAGLPESVARPDDEGRWRFDLVAANEEMLGRAGVPRGAVMRSGECTSCNPQRYFSHRRESGLTGRHWAGVRAQAR